MSTIGQNSLQNFYSSLRFNDPNLAARLSEDVVTVGLYGLAADKSPAEAAVKNLRDNAYLMPEALRRVMEGALAQLGYS